MDIFLKYKRESYLESLDGPKFLLEWKRDIDEIKSALNTFFSKKHIVISEREIQDVIDEVELENIDHDFTVKVVVQKGNFDKSLPSKKSGVTVKFVFLAREMVENKAHWYVYGLGSGLFNSRSNLNITKENELGYTTYLSISEKDDNASKSIPNTIEKLRKKLLTKQFTRQARDCGVMQSMEFQ